MKRKKKYSIRSRMIALMFLCWCVPLFLMLGVAANYMISSHFEERADAQLNQIISDDRMSVERLNNVVHQSKGATSDRQIENAFLEYKKGKIHERKLLERSSDYLGKSYGHESRIKNAVLWFYEKPLKMRCHTVNKNAGGDYKDVSLYWSEDHEEIADYAETLDTSIGFLRKDGRLYLVRNLMDASYRPFAVLVIQINTDCCFESQDNYPKGTDITVRIGSCVIPLRGARVEDKALSLNKSVPASGYRWVKGRLLFYHRMEGDGYWLETFYNFSDNSAFMPFYGYSFIIVGAVLLALPLLWLGFRIFRKHIAAPVDAMIAAAKEMENGTLGCQIELEAESTEFDYLIDTFNRMSRRMQEQFVQLYDEEVALKDAKIKALQSHINPHFLNNTLEIINWEARMGGNQKVSEMIGALSTLMDATMDRKKKPEVTLSEEMVYVNAYLYIASRRLGSRLEVINELPQDIMDCKVPRLILQPVIENAVEHGAAKHRHGTVRLNGYKAGGYLYIEITNDHVLTEEEEERIARLLDVEYDTSRESSGNIGISNVNQRLRILYGEPCGLTIKMKDEKWVEARLVILQEKKAIKSNK